MTRIASFFACAGFVLLLAACGGSPVAHPTSPVPAYLPEEVPQPGAPTVTSHIGSTLVTWEAPGSLGSFVLTHIYRNTVYDFTSATKIASARLMFLDESVERNKTYWYWIRWESPSTGRLSPVSPSVQNSRGLTPDEVADDVEDWLADSELLEELRQPIGEVHHANGLSKLRIGDESLAPVYRQGGTLHVGTDLSPRHRLHSVRGQTGVSYGRLYDREGRRSISSYIVEHASRGEWKRFDGLETFHRPPVLRFARTTSNRQMEQVIQSVQLLNEALPPQWHIHIGGEVPELASHVPHGEIYVDFAAWADWQDPGKPPEDRAIGICQHFVNHLGERSAAHVWIDPAKTEDQHIVKILVHELIHAIGLVEHIARPDTIMPADGEIFWTYGSPAIFPVDRDAVTAAYTWLDPGDTPREIYEKLGAWADDSLHFVGETPSTDFGVVFSNGFAQPWASGTVPLVNLADSQLRGRVTWNGHMVGFTPRAESVAGDARISVRLSTLRGDARFDQLEAWAPNQTPGPEGTGVRWGDGDLDYTIAVRGNTFHRTGGDEGALTGVFVGTTHKGTVGTLERTDLTAAFGADRR